MLPPKWADRFLKWYCNPDLLEEIQGDVYELFERRADTEGKKKAALQFVWDVIKFCRWSNIKKSNSTYYSINHFTMYRNYIKVGFRNLTKNWLISGINISGLALAIGCAITTFIFVDSQSNLDSFHKNKGNIYQVINQIQTKDELQLWGDSPLLMGPEIQSNNSSVKNIVRIEYDRGSMRYKDRVFSESVVFVDPAFTSTFDYPIAAGNPYCLKKKEEVVISHSMAEKYFGDLSPIGETISIKFSNGIIQSYFIGAVFEKYPTNASFSFNILIPIQNFFDLKFQDHYDLSKFTDATFVEMHDGHHPDELAETMADIRINQNKTQTKWPIHGFEFVKLPALGQRSFEISDPIAGGSHPAGQVALSVISILLLTMACFNYMNISLAAGTKRLKEIALRKVMGGVRTSIISQFLIENVILCVIALLVGTALSYYIFLPGFNSMIPLHIPFQFSSFSTALIFFGSILLVLGLISGAYPAFYISRFEPVTILKGQQKLGTKSILSKLLLGLQFVLAFSTIVACFVFTDNALYMKSQDWGYDPNNILSIRINDVAQFNSLRDATLKDTHVEHIAGSRAHVTRTDPTTSIESLGNQIQTKIYTVGSDYLQAMNIRLIDGRLFEKEESNDQLNTVISAKFAKKMGWVNPLEHSFTYDSTKYQVIGVVEDFHYNGFYSEVLPIFFVLDNDASKFRYFTAQVTPGHMLEVSESLEHAWREATPNDPYDVFYQEDALRGFYEENHANIVIITFISGFAIILACLGLFGLLTFNLSRRMKEFSVRKVLGAKGSHIVKLANEDYVWVLLISFLIGAPFGYFGIAQLIESIYPDPPETSIFPFILAITIMVVTVAITVSGQILKAIRVNPADTLRNE